MWFWFLKIFAAILLDFNNIVVNIWAFVLLEGGGGVSYF